IHDDFRKFPLRNFLKPSDILSKKSLYITSLFYQYNNKYIKRLFPYFLLLILNKITNYIIFLSLDIL
ncbi:hypothetical protein EH331_11905, partial [Enterococcus faecalis]|nr:hypothetical protein [Enterococcus faecalis]